MTVAIASERREFVAELELDPETRADGSGLKLSGHAAVFNSESRDLGFRETIRPGAFKRALSRPETDVYLLFGHAGQPLARQSAGNLELREDGRGLAFNATLANTTLARDLVELVRAGVVQSMSFAFSVTPAGYTERTVNGERLREIHSIDQIYEISAVTEPAYEATDVAARGSTALDAIRARRPARPRQGPYAPESQFSFWRDLAASDREINLVPHPVHGAREQAVKRLAEQRAIGSGQYMGGPAFLGDLFAEVIRIKAAVASALHSEPLPKALQVSLPRLDTGTTVGYQADNSAVSDTTPTTDQLGPSNISTIAGMVDASQQSLDMSPGGLLDLALTRDLAAAYAEMLEQEVVAGSGAAGPPQHLTGLLNVAGVAQDSYTDASPTAQKLYPVLQSSYATAQAAEKGGINAVAVHPTRAAWFTAQYGGAGQPVPAWPARLIESFAIPTTWNTNQDPILFLDLDDLILLESPELQQLVDVNTGSGTLTVRYRVHRYVTLLARRSTDIRILSGTGLVSPPVF